MIFAGPQLELCEKNWPWSRKSRVFNIGLCIVWSKVKSVSAEIQQKDFEKFQKFQFIDLLSPSEERANKNI